MHCLGRRWRTGSDDFVLSGVFFGLAQIAMGSAAAVILGWGSGHICEVDVTNLAAGHPSGTVSPETIGLLAHAALRDAALGLYSVATNTEVTMRVQSGAYLFSGLALLLLGFASSRGRIMEHRRRAVTVPLALYASFFGLVAVTALSIVVAVMIYGSDDRLAPCRVDGAHHGTRVRAIAHGQCILGFIPLVLFAALFVASYDPSGRKAYSEDSVHAYTDLWNSRFGWAVCRCLRRDDASREAFKDIAAAFSTIFQGVDLVPSDIAAGMVLVRGHQHRILGEGIKGKSFPPTSSKNDDVCCSCCVSVEEKVSRQCRAFSPVSHALQRDVEILYRYRRFFMATYGWALAIFKDPREALPMICCNPCFYCRSPQWGHAKGEMCMCDSNILLRVGHLAESDVIVTDFRNGLYQSPHFVVIDQSPDRPDQKAIVVGIRGSMSISDALTDLVVTPAELHFRSAAMREKFGGGGPCLVHGGMLRTTENVLANLESNGVLTDLVDGKYKNLKLVLVGHSLGAGAVVILSILIHDRYPSLKDRLTCVAYAPPGGLLTKNLSDYTASYVVGGFFGVDVVPRLAVHTIEDLRTSIIDAICASKNAKATVLCSMMRPARTRLLASDEAPTAEVVRAREELLASGVAPSVLQKASMMTSVSDGLPTVVVAGNGAGGGVRPATSGGRLLTPITAVSGGTTADTPMMLSDAEAQNNPAANVNAAAANNNTNANANPALKNPSSRRPSNARTYSTDRGSVMDGSAPTCAVDNADPHTATFRTHKMYPPGRMVHFAKAITRDTKCLFGAFNWDRTEFYVPTHIGVEAVQEIVCCPRMLTDHFPNNLFYVLENCYERMATGGLDVFFEGATATNNYQPAAGGARSYADPPPPAASASPGSRPQSTRVERPLSPTTASEAAAAGGAPSPLGGVEGASAGGVSITILDSAELASPYAGGLTSIAYRFPSSANANVGVGGGGGGPSAAGSPFQQEPSLRSSPANYGGIIVSPSPSGSGHHHQRPVSGRQQQQQHQTSQQHPSFTPTPLGSADGGYAAYQDVEARRRQ